MPCVRVPREEGERVRQALADRGLLDRDRQVVAEDDAVYLPVTDPAAVPEEYDLRDRELPRRDRQTTPRDLLAFAPTYERVGDVVVVDEDDPDRARQVAAAVVESDLPARAVLRRASKVKGEERVREYEVLATADRADADDGARPAADGAGADTDADAGADADSGETADRSPTETVHREYGCEYLLDLSAVYFSPRLATERHRVAERVEPGEFAVDMFAGVGPFVVPFAKRGATVVGVDVNPTAVAYLRENARRNGVADRVTAVEGDVHAVAPDYADRADRIVMNLPHSADEFLDAAVTMAGADCTVHYYDIQGEDDPYGPGERAVRAAAAPEYDVTVETRRTVRSYAPHELNVVLNVRLRRR